MGLLFVEVTNPSGMRSHIRVKDKIPEYFEPRGVVGQIVVELWGDPTNFSQPGVRDVWEVMVLNVVPYVEEDGVEGAVVTHGGLSFEEEIMLRDEVTSRGMEAKTPGCSQEEINQGLGAKTLEDEVVERKLDNPVNDLQGGGCFRALAEGTNTMNDGVAQKPEGFGQRVTEEA